MKSDFVKINESRIRKSTIKKYLPFNQKKINIYFNSSRYKIEVFTFDFNSVEERDKVIDYLDLQFNIS